MHNLTELRSELAAPVKSFRIFAISRAMELKASQELLDCLNECRQIACIETLMKNYPDRLKSQLHKLIHVNDPVIRSLAILTVERGAKISRIPLTGFYVPLLPKGPIHLFTLHFPRRNHTYNRYSCGK